MGTRPLRTRRFSWKASCPPFSTGNTSWSRAFSRRVRLTTKGTRCFLLGSLGKRRTRRTLASPAFKGIARTYSGPFCTQLATWPRASVRPVPCSVKIRTTGCIGDSSCSSKYVRASSASCVPPMFMWFAEVNRLGFLAQSPHIGRFGSRHCSFGKT